MSTAAIISLVLSLVILWGGLTASTIFLSRRSEVEEYPAGLDDEGEILRP